MSRPPPLIARFGDYVLDEANARLQRGEQAVDLAPRAFDVLCALVRHGGRLVSKDDLLDRVWGHRHVSESVLKSTISQLRASLNDDPRQPRFIETASRRGYRFIAPLNGAAPQAASPPGAADAGPGARAPQAPPPAPVAAARSRLVGREAALERLHAALGATRHAMRRVVFVAGDAGIGKSTLVEHFLREAQAGGVRCASGQCVELRGGSEPYMPVLEALAALLRGDAGAPLVDLMRRVAPTWLVQLPWLLNDDDRRHLQREVAGTTQDRMLREIGEWLDRAAASEPLVLLLEDLHWSDQATVQLVGYLARRRGPAALLVLATFRLTEVVATDHALAGLRHELRAHRLCEEIDLDGWSETETGEWLAERLGAAVPEDFVRRLHAHTGGLPLFLRSLLDELLARGELRREGADGRWRYPAADAALGLPSDVVGMVETQIARLPDEQQRRLGAASVAADEFLDHLLAAVLGEAPEALSEALDALAARSPWIQARGVEQVADGRVSARHVFSHALYRQVFYARLSGSQRVALHRRWAEAIERHGGAARESMASELAMHAERAGDAPTAAAALVVVARRALGVSAPEEALRAVRHGLPLCAAIGDPARRDEIELELRLLEGMALTRRVVISEPEVAAVFEKALALSSRVPPGPARARALQALWWVQFARGELVTAHALAADMSAMARASGHVAMRVAAHNACGLTARMMGEFSRARDELEASLALMSVQTESDVMASPFVQHPGVEARAYLATVCWHLGQAQRARALAAEANELALSLRHPLSQFIALVSEAGVQHFAGEPEAVLRTIDRLELVIERHDMVRGPSSFSWLRGHALVTLGREDEGFALMLAGKRRCEELGLRLGFTSYYFHHAEACVETGRFDEAQALARQGLALAEHSGERCLMAPLERTLARALDGLDDASGARAARARALAIAREQAVQFHELLVLVDGGFEREFDDRARSRATEIALLGDGSPPYVMAWRQLQPDTGA